MSLTQSDMPGPSPEAKAAQFAQWQLREAYYEARRAAPAGEAHQDPAVQQALSAYDASVDALEALMGPDAHCSQVDCELWGEFSDFYKDEVGFRPRGMHFTRQSVLAWIARQSEAMAA